MTRNDALKWALAGACLWATACGADAPGPAADPAADTTDVTASGDAALDAAAESDTVAATDAGVADGGAVAQADAGDASTCGCPTGQICDGDTCVAPPKPCGGDCPEGKVCDKKADGGKGVCKTPTCKLPTKFGPELQKMNTFKLFPTEQGCDLTDDGKADNSMGSLLALAGSAIEHSVSSGDVKLILKALPYKTDGTAFELRMLSASLDPSNKDCQFNEQICVYTISDANYDLAANTNDTCPAGASLKTATIKDGKLSGGGKGFGFAIPIPLSGVKLELPFENAQIEGLVQSASKWKSTGQGKLCGVIPKPALFAALELVPEEQLKGIGGKSGAKAFLNTLLVADIDLDGDGKLEGVSAGFSFTTIGAEVVGITP